MLERFLVKPIKELIHGKPTDYDFNIDKNYLPIYFETASFYSKEHLRLKILAKGGEFYITDTYAAKLRPNVVRLRVSTTEKGKRADIRKDFFEEVKIMEQKIKDGKWQISIETQKKVRDALGNPDFNG